MPIYAYRCANCGHAQDVLQKISDPVLTVCPACGQAALVKQVTAAGFQLKGSGWYVTDFRDDQKKKAAKPADEGEGAKKADEAKPEAAVEGKAGDGKGGDKRDGKADDSAKNKAEAPSASPAPAPASSPAPAPASAPAAASPAPGAGKPSS